MLLVKIHTKYYDLTNFKHPGGYIPISLAVNRDATALFESHHLFSNRDDIMQILHKFEVEVNPSLIPNNNDFDWNETLISNFTKDLKTIANATLKYNNIKIGLYGIIEISILFLSYIINLYFYYQGYTIALLLYPLSLWIFTVNIYHDASHFAMSFKPLINQLCTYSGLMFSLTYCWYHQHVVGHHTGVNLLHRDPDLYHSPLFVRHTSNIRKNKFHSYQHLHMFLLWLVAVPIGLITTGFIKTIKNKPYNKLVPLSTELHKNSMYYQLSFIIFYMIILPYLYTPSIWFVLYPYIVYSFLFMICTQVNHLTEECFGHNKNYYIHQIINSHNVAPQSFIVTLFTGGLNLQIEHHLFPSVHHTNLKLLQPKIKELCKKYSIPYNYSDNLFQAILKHFRNVKKYSI